MEEDILSKARKKHEGLINKKIDKRIFGEGEGTHIFSWTKRIIEILSENGKLTIHQISNMLIKKYPEDYERLPENEIKNSIKSVLQNLSKKEKLENLRDININIIYGHGLKLKNNGPNWWIESITEKPKDRMKKILDLVRGKK